MSSKPEIGMYVILGLVVVNIMLTIYCYRRPQEDYQVYNDWRLGRRSWEGRFAGRR